MPNQQPDFARIKRNVLKMIDLGAPEADIDAYLEEEGVTAEDLRAHKATGANSPSRQQSHTGGLTPRASHGGDNPDHIVDAKMAFIAKALGVGLDDPLTPQQLEAFRQAYVRTEGANSNNVGNLKVPGSDTQFQEFATPDAGLAAIDAQIRRDYNRGQTSIRSLIEGYPIGQMPMPPEVKAQGPEEEGYDPSTDTINVVDYGREAPQRHTPQQQPQPTTGTLEAAGRGALDGISFGLDDEVGSGIAALIPGLSKRSVWDGSSFSEAYDANVSDYRGKKDAAWKEHPWAYGAGGLASALVPFGAVGAGARLAREGVTASRGLAAAMREGAVMGGAYGFGSDTGSVTDRLDGAAAGAALGAGGGAILKGAATGAGKLAGPLVDKLAPELAQRRFARSQLDNPHAVTDAAVASDLEKLVSNLKTSKSAKGKLSKDQSATLLSRVDDLEESYLPTNELKALDLAPSTKARLSAAMAKRHLLSDAEVEALRDGTAAGDAVADGIAKARRLRAYVAEGPSGGAGGGASKAIAEAIGTAIGYKAAGPIGGAIGSAATRVFNRTNGTKAALAAQKLAEDAPRFSKLPQVLDAMAAKDTQASDGLTRLSAEALDAPYLAKKEAQAEAERLAAQAKEVSKANARDNITPSGGWRGLLYQRTGLLPADQDAGALKALKDGAITQEQFQAFLDSPDKLMAGNAGNALSDRLAAQADAGTLKRDPKWTKPTEATPGSVAANLSQREAELMAELDKVDPVIVTLADGTSSRGSELGDDVYRMSAEDRSKADSIRQQLTALKAPQAAPSTQAIRNPIAYAMAAQGNQSRVTKAFEAVHGNADLGDAERELLATAVSSIGSTSSRTKAQEIAVDALDRLDAGRRDYARSILSPLVEQVKK